MRLQDLNQRKSRILSASNGGLNWLIGYYPYEFRKQGARAYANKGKRKVSIKELNRIWFARDWTEEYPSGDIFKVAAEANGLQTHGKDFIKVLEILERELNITPYDPITPRSLTPPTSFTSPITVTPKKPFAPNSAHEPEVSYTYVETHTTQARNNTFARWYITPATLDTYQVRELISIKRKDEGDKKGYDTYTRSDRPLFLFQNGENKKVYSPKPLWGEGSTKTVYLQSSGDYVFGYDQLPEQCKGILFAAGQKDTLALNERLNKHSIYAICLNSETQAIPPELFADLQARAEWIGVLYDNDTTGLISSWKTWLAYNVKWLSFERSINDVCDWLEEKQDPARFETLVLAQTDHLDTSEKDDPLHLRRLVKFFQEYFDHKLQITTPDWKPKRPSKKAAIAYIKHHYEEELPKDVKRLVKAIESQTGLPKKQAGRPFALRSRGACSDALGKHVFCATFFEKSCKESKEECSCKRHANTSELDTIELTARKFEKSASRGRMSIFDYSPDFIRELETKRKEAAAKMDAHKWMLANRKKNRYESKKLRRLAQESKDADNRLTIERIANKKTLCSYFFAGRQLPTGEVLRVGTNFCKHKACPICSYIVSKERKKAVMNYFTVNRRIHQRLSEIGKEDPIQLASSNQVLSPEVEQALDHLLSIHDTECEEYKEAMEQLMSLRYYQPLAQEFELEEKDVEKHISLDINKYHFYHLTLTLQHDETNRAGDYSKELLDSFKWLRDNRKGFVYQDYSTCERKVIRFPNCKKDAPRWHDEEGKEVFKIENNRTWWNRHVDGGFYSMEVVGNKSDNPNDHSLHIHLHTLVLSEIELEKTDFADELRKRWKARSGGDSHQIQLERAYRLDEERKKIYYYPGQGEEGEETLDRVLSETCKYSLKMDFEGIGADGDTMASLLAPGKRYFNFFGCLYGKGITNFTYDDIQNVHLTDNQLFSPTTGEVFEQSETTIAITTINNVIYTPVKGYPVYQYLDPRKLVAVNLQYLPAEIAGMTKPEFRARLREKAVKKVLEANESAGNEEGNVFEAYLALIDELDFKGTLFEYENQEWVISLSQAAEKAAADMEYMNKHPRESAQKKAALDEIRILKTRLCTGNNSQREIELLEEALQDAEERAGISRDYVPMKYIDDEEYQQYTKSYLKYLLQIDTWDSNITESLSKKEEEKYNKYQMHHALIDGMIEDLPERYHYKLTKAAKGFQRINIQGTDIHIVPFEQTITANIDTHEKPRQEQVQVQDQTQEQSKDQALPYGCKLIQLYSIQAQQLHDHAQLQHRRNQPPPTSNKNIAPF